MATTKKAPTKKTAIIPLKMLAANEVRSRRSPQQAFRKSPTDERASRLRLEFDELFATETKYDALNDRIAKTRAKREELLTVLSNPAIPLHNNTSELGARVSARRRDVSLHSHSESARWTSSQR
ncbi:MAG: hypothetical protein KDB27_22400 [Planctomycetales bacterium]|nr:hypothetical protein [Planctomycetales bacterium]